MYYLNLFLIIFIHLFSIGYCENTKTLDLVLNQTYSNFNEDLGVSYYKLIIDSNENNYDLMITVKPTDFVKDFSDPDIFVSKVLIYSNRLPLFLQGLQINGSLQL